MNAAAKIKAVRAAADEMEALATSLRAVCEVFVDGLMRGEESAAMSNVDVLVGRAMQSLRSLESPERRSLWDGERPRWQDEIAKLAAERVRFIVANRDRLVDAWVAETGWKPSESEIVEQHDPDGTVRVSVRKKTATGPRPCRHGFVGRCPYRAQDPPVAGWVPEADCHGPPPRPQDTSVRRG